MHEWTRRIALCTCLVMVVAAHAKEKGMPREFKVFLIACPSADSLTAVTAEDTQATEQYLRLLRRDNQQPDLQGITVHKLPCPFPGADMFVCSGWYMGGHMFYPGAALARRDGTIAVVRAVMDAPPYATAVAFQGNTVRHIEPKRNRPDLDLTSVILQWLSGARDDGTLSEAAMLELTHLLVIVYHSRPRVFLQIPLSDVDPKQLRALATERGWTLLQSEYSPDNWENLVRPADTEDPPYPRYRCVIGRKGVSLTCAATVDFGAHRTLEAITFESDYESLSLTSKTVHHHPNMIH